MLMAVGNIHNGYATYSTQKMRGNVQTRET